ncbi:MAG: family 20 glycosylhydrolase [Treponema sp.]|jgi:hexosaminidase|nr:family 20 glycosylhydrolase [Treponema sp.]
MTNELLLKKELFQGKPVYDYRGTMLDVSRHFFGVDEVRRLLDVMYRLRLNKFHWHFSDDQGFRIALKNYPKLEEIASKRSFTAYGGFLKKKFRDNTPYAGFYTEEEVRSIVSYATERGIEVIPELSMPGHSSALVAAYPELSCSGEKIEVPGDFGVMDNVLCIGNDDVMRFMDKLLHTLVDLFEAKTFHIDFDEVRLTHLKTCPKCQAKMKELGTARVEDLKLYAKNFFRDSLKKQGLEVILYNDGMEEADTSVVCFHWDSRDKLGERTVQWINEGQQTIIANCEYLYMDYPYVWTPLKKTYSFNPVLKGVAKPENIIGVEAPLWTESVEGHPKLAFNAYYRLAALAEIGWFGEKRRPYKEFIKRLRENEEYFFGEKLNIPDRILNPNLFRRLRMTKKSLMQDMNCEFREVEKFYFSKV